MLVDVKGLERQFSNIIEIFLNLEKDRNKKLLN